MDHQAIYAILDTMLQQPRLRTLYQTIRREFEAHGSVAHGWEHVRRVIINAAWVGSEEDADLQIVMPAIILHDIGFVTNPEEPKKHPEHGARECFRFLADWPVEQQHTIAGCILKHKGTFPGYSGVEPETLEERAVCDADQLDKFGWIGITQLVKVYTEYAVNGAVSYGRHSGLVEALRRLNNITLYTETGRRIAQELSTPDYIAASRRLADELSLSENWKDPI